MRVQRQHGGGGGVLCWSWQDVHDTHGKLQSVAGNTGSALEALCLPCLHSLAQRCFGHIRSLVAGPGTLPVAAAGRKPVAGRIAAVHRAVVAAAPAADRRGRRHHRHTFSMCEREVGIRGVRGWEEGLRVGWG